MSSRSGQESSSSLPPFRLGLISMPWQLFNRPSIQLGALKAFLHREADWIAVDTFHPYLEVADTISPAIYHLISKDIWISEALYGALLFPEQKEKLLLLINQALKKNSPGSVNEFHFEKILTALTSHLDSFLQMDWHLYDLVGFTLCFNQLLASLTAAASFKKKFPDLPLIFGGSACSRDLGEALLENFTIDYVINGEGELPLLDLCTRLAQGDRIKSSGALITRLPTGSSKPVKKTNFQVEQIDNLESLPVPDFSDYFNELTLYFTDTPFVPELPIEFSRGCWWRKCTFCNLNLQWQGYRFKKTPQLMDEISTLAEKFACLDFVFADNALPQKEAESFFRLLGLQQRDYRFFAEIRFSKKHGLLATLKQGGLNTVQVGIEALSNSLLEKLNKGVTVMDNIAFIKEAAQQTILLEGNLIIEFPGSTKDEVDETLRNLEFILPFHPLSQAVFFLGHSSPVYCNPEQYGITGITQHNQFKKIFPKNLHKKLPLLVMDYQGQKSHQRKLWQPVAKKIKTWQEFHRKRSAKSVPALSYRTGNSFLLIRQELPGQATLHHRLRGVSQQIYLFCTTIRKQDEILDRFKTISSDKLVAFLRELENKRLLFSDQDSYLALAIHEE